MIWFVLSSAAVVALAVWYGFAFWFSRASAFTGADRFECSRCSLPLVVVEGAVCAHCRSAEAALLRLERKAALLADLDSVVPLWSWTPDGWSEVPAVKNGGPSFASWRSHDPAVYEFRCLEDRCLFARVGVTRALRRRLFEHFARGGALEHFRRSGHSGVVRVVSRHSTMRQALEAEAERQACWRYLDSRNPEDRESEPERLEGWCVCVEDFRRCEVCSAEQLQ